MTPDSVGATPAEHWIRSLDGIEDRLRAGARVADVGCGSGATVVALSSVFCSSTFAGFDPDAAAIGEARRAAARAGVSDRVTFEVASAEGFPGEAYDLVCLLRPWGAPGDALPIGAARRARHALTDAGALLLVSPADDAAPVRAVARAAGLTRLRRAAAPPRLFEARP